MANKIPGEIEIAEAGDAITSPDVEARTNCGSKRMTRWRR